MWHVEALVRGESGLYCPLGCPSFPTKKLAIADILRWRSGFHNESRVKFIRVVDENTGRFYCLDRKDPRYPGGIAHHKWMIATSSGSRYGVDWLTRSEAERDLKELQRDGYKDLSIRPSKLFWNMYTEDDANQPCNYRWIELSGSGVKVHLLNTVYPAKTLCGKVVKEPIPKSVKRCFSAEERCKSCAFSKTLPSKVQDALVI